MEEKISLIVSQSFGINKDKINSLFSIKEETDYDLMSLYDMCASLESEFQCEIEIEEIKKVDTIQDLVEFIEKKIKQDA